MKIHVNVIRKHRKIHVTCAKDQNNCFSFAECEHTEYEITTIDSQPVEPARQIHVAKALICPSWSLRRRSSPQPDMPAGSLWRVVSHVTLHTHPQHSRVGPSCAVVVVVQTIRGTHASVWARTPCRARESGSPATAPAPTCPDGRSRKIPKVKLPSTRCYVPSPTVRTIRTAPSS